MNQLEEMESEIHELLEKKLAKYFQQFGYQCKDAGVEKPQ